MTTTVVSLKGRIHDWGPSLEHAPAEVVYIGRRLTMGGWRLAGSDWANPYTTRMAGTVERAVEFYRAWLVLRPDMVERARDELAGKTLACWCKPGQPCHGHVLIQAIEFKGPWVEIQCGDYFGNPLRLSRHIADVQFSPEAAGIL